MPASERTTPESHVAGGGDGASDGVSTTRRVLRNTALVAVGDAATRVGVFVLYAVIARSLGESGFGDYTLAVSLAFFVRVSALGTDVILSREVARDVQRMHGLFWDTLVLKVAAGTPVTVGIVVFAAASGYGLDVVLAVALIGASNLVDILSFSIHSVLRGREEMGPPAKALAVENLVVVVLGSIALLALGWGLVALGAAYLIAAFVALAYVWALARRRGLRPRRAGRHPGARVAGARGGADGHRLVLQLRAGAHRRGDPVDHDPRQRGRRSLRRGLPDLRRDALRELGPGPRAVPAALAVQARQPRAASPVRGVVHGGHGGDRAPLGCVMALFGPTLVEAVFGSDFANAGTATRILGGAAALYGTFTVAALVIAAQDRQSLLPWISAVALVVNVALNIALIPSLSLDGAAIAMTATQVVATGIALVFAAREVGGVSPVRMFSAATVGLCAMTGTAALLGFEAVVLRAVAGRLRGRLLRLGVGPPSR